MALKDDVLNNFFSKASSKKSKLSNNHSYHRVFDDPKSVEQEDKNIIEEKKPSNTSISEPPNKKSCQNNNKNLGTTYGQHRDKDGDNIKTRVGQHKDKNRDNIETNEGQPIDKNKTTYGHSKGQDKDKIKTNIGTQVETEMNSIPAPNNIITQEDIYALSSSKDLIVGYIVNLCARKGSLKTPPITTKIISTALGLKLDSVRKSIFRLKKEGVISSADSKKGKYSCYQITEEVRAFYLDKQSNFAPNIRTNVGTNIGTDPNVVSSSNINNTTTKNTNLPEAWLNLDTTPLIEQGLNQSHLIQIYREYNKKPELALSMDIIQDSINHLSYDIRHNDAKSRLKSEPVPFLVSMLKKGQPYSSTTPDKVLSPKEEAMQRYIENKKREKEKLEEMQKELFNVEYDGWSSNLAADEIEHIVDSTSGLLFNRKREPQIALRKHFKDKIWPNIKDKVADKVIS